MRFPLVLLAAAVAAASGAPAAHAAFVASATGTSVSGDYTLRYAVFQRDGGETQISGAGNSGVAASDFNPLPFVSGLPPVFDDGAFSAFFYQVIGPAANSDLVLSLSNMLGANFTSAGFVDNGSVAGLNAQSGGGFVNGGYEADGTGEGANLTFDLDDPITGGAAPSNVLFRHHERAEHCFRYGLSLLRVRQRE